MPLADSISASDRALMKRMTVVLFILVFLTALVSRLEGLYSAKFHDVTGDAQWIWPRSGPPAREPVAFFATRDFELPERRLFTHLKILGDPEYTLYVNGREIAGRRAGHAGSSAEDERLLALYDISELVQTGSNRIVVAVRSPQGFGGLIAAIDLAPERQNWLVTDGTWRIYRQWHGDLLDRDPAEVRGEPPLLIGEPPVGRWNFPRLEPIPMLDMQTTVLRPQATFQVDAAIPRIRTSGGIAVAVAEPARGTAFDFGFTTGRVRLTSEGRRYGSHAILVRLANHRDELSLAEWNLRPVVFAPNETSITIPEAYSFRYVMVFTPGVQADVVLSDQ